MSDLVYPLKTEADPVAVAAVGVEKRTYSSLEIFFRSKCNNKYVLVEEENADISIIDMDGYKATTMLEQHKINFPDRPVILISLKENNFYTDLFIQKPIKISALVSILNTAKKMALSNRLTKTGTGMKIQAVMDSSAPYTIYDSPNHSSSDSPHNGHGERLKDIQKDNHNIDWYDGYKDGYDHARYADANLGNPKQTGNEQFKTEGDDIKHNKVTTGLAQQGAVQTAQEHVDAEQHSDAQQSSVVEPPVLNDKIPIINAQAEELSSSAKLSVKSPEREDQKKWSTRSLESFVTAHDSGFHLLSNEFQKDGISSRALREFRYDPENMLQGYFKRAYDTALTSRCNVRIEGPWRPLTILIKRHEVLVESDFRHIFALSAMTFTPDEVSITLLREDEDDILNEGGITQSIEQFLWKLSLRTSRGRLPVTADVNVPILLKQWPNFTRTTVTPHALRIAALWSRQPTTLLKTAKILDISLSYVFVFYSSALPLNLLTHLQDNQQLAEQIGEIKQHTYRDLFSSLIKKLKNKKSAELS